MDATGYNVWAKRFLWPFNLPKDCPVHALDPASEDCARWVRELQAEHGLRVDGALGPSTLFVCMALWGDGPGAVGSAIVGGQPLDLGTPVVRFFAPGQGTPLMQPPDVGMLLSVASLELNASRRRKGELAPRCHFTIESGRGAHGRSLVLQWADPLEAVAFTAHDADESDLYPLRRHAVGVELENPLVVHERSHEQRTRHRTREVVAADVNGRRARQLELFEEQLATLDALLAALEDRLGLPRRFPLDDTGTAYDTAERPHEHWATWQGWLARFHLADRLAEPGMGLVVALPRLFGELEAPAASESTQAGPSSSSGSPREQARIPPAPPAAIPPPSPAPDAAQAWAIEAASPVLPPAAIEESFSMGRVLQGRPGRRRNRRSRAEAMRERLLRHQGSEEDPPG